MFSNVSIVHHYLFTYAKLTKKHRKAPTRHDEKYDLFTLLSFFEKLTKKQSSKTCG